MNPGSGMQSFGSPGMTMAQTTNVDVANDRSATRKPDFRTLSFLWILAANRSIFGGYPLEWGEKRRPTPLNLQYFPV